MSKRKKAVVFHPTSVRLPEDLRNDLKTEADAQQWSQTHLIIEILRQWQSYKHKERKHAR